MNVPTKTRFRLRPHSPISALKMSNSGVYEAGDGSCQDGSQHLHHAYGQETPQEQNGRSANGEQKQQRTEHLVAEIGSEPVGSGKQQDNVPVIICFLCNNNTSIQ